MTFLPKLLIFIAGCTVISTKSHYYDYQYQHQPFKNFHIPWPIKFPQPLISLDGSWAIGSPPGMYPYYPSKEYEEYPYPEDDYQQELLVQSLNQALIKLNQLFPPISSNLQETAPFPPTTKPEVLAEALNKAIERLAVLLTRQPQNVPESAEIPENIATNAPESAEVPENVATTTLNVSESAEVPENVAATTLKVPEIVTTTEVPQQSTVSEENILNSADSAIDEINKLYTSLPDELKNKPSETPITSNENIPKEPFLSQPAPFISPEKMANPLFLSQTSETLFTSNILEQSKVTDKPQASISVTSVPDIVSNSGITTEIDESKLFTSLETTSPAPEETTEIPVIENKAQATDLPIKEAESDMTTIRNYLSSMSPQIDIRFKEREDSGFIFPDEFEELYNKKKKPAMKQEINLPSRFGEKEPIVSTSNPQTVLEYKPSRPPFHADVFPPNPTPKPGTDLSDRNKETTQPINNQNPQIYLEYKPSRPPFHPDIYPPNPTPKPQPQPDSNLQTSTVAVGDRFEATTTRKPVNQISLEYVPSRPPFHPDIFPPHPTPRPQTDSNLQTSTVPSVGDRFEATTTRKPVNQISLEYVPSRPPIHPDIYPPHPTPRPQTDSNLQTVDVGDRFQSTQPTTVTPAKPTTEFIVTTTQGLGPYVPTHYYPTPINLEYVPSRPFYAPHPIVYPRPGAIPPGTPWPASSTERPRN